FRFESTRLEQEARGRLERQEILGETEVEKNKKNLLKMQTTVTALASTGEARAKVLAQAESERIREPSAVEQSKLHVEEKRIRTEAELQRMERIRQLELSHMEARHALELKLQQTQAQMEASKFSRMVKAVSQHTLGLMATAGAEHDVQMLLALGLRSTLITDGSAPINLFTTAAGLLGHV
ncbi:Major vault protein, partial [Paragonimus westermani]